MSAREPFQGRALTASLTVRDLDESLRWYHDVVGGARAFRLEDPDGYKLAISSGIAPRSAGGGENERSASS